MKCRTDEQNAISQKKAESDYFRSSKIIQGYTDPFIRNHSILLVTRVSDFEKKGKFRNKIELRRRESGRSWVELDDIGRNGRFSTNVDGPIG